MATIMTPSQSFYQDQGTDSVSNDQLVQDYEDSDSLIEDAMIGLADSQDLRSRQYSEERSSTTARAAYEGQEGPLADALPSTTSLLSSLEENATRTEPVKRHSLICNGTSSSANESAADRERPTVAGKRLHALTPLQSGSQPPVKRSKHTAVFDEDDLPDDVLKQDTGLAEKPLESRSKENEDIEDWILKEFGGCVEIVG